MMAIKKNQWLSLSLLLFFVSAANSFYLPGVAPEDYNKGDPLKVKVNKLTSTKTQLPYPFYSLHFCRPDKIIIDSAENLGEILREVLGGDRIENSPYVLKMREPQMCNVLCRIALNAKAAKEFQKKIGDGYRVNMILDNHPLVNPIKRQDEDSSYVYQHGYFIGTKAHYAGSKEEKYFINNHLVFKVKYHEDPQTELARIVGFEVRPFSVKHAYEGGKWTRLSTCNPETNHRVTGSDSPQEVEDKQEIIFTYDVEFEASLVSHTHW